MYAPQLLLTMEDPTDVPLPPFQERQPCVGHRLLHVLGLCATDGVLPGRVEAARDPMPPFKANP